MTGWVGCNVGIEVEAGCWGGVDDRFLLADSTRAARAGNFRFLSIVVVVLVKDVDDVALM